MPLAHLTQIFKEFTFSPQILQVFCTTKNEFIKRISCRQITWELMIIVVRLELYMALLPLYFSISVSNLIIACHKTGLALSSCLLLTNRDSNINLSIPTIIYRFFLTLVLWNSIKHSLIYVTNRDEWIPIHPSSLGFDPKDFYQHLQTIFNSICREVWVLSSHPIWWPW